MKSRQASIEAVLLLCVVCACLGASNLVVDITRPLHDVSDHLWGVFFEEINHAGVGGLYAELIQDRSFEANYKLASISPGSLPSVSLRRCNSAAYLTNIASQQDQLDSTFISFLVFILVYELE
eukprot:TRINITY_DN8174_c0_g1_i3.p1 TRINITY_DN8174_c0_g1~~TRINITY_DN8174_c0_g1_i3.p1  ORF type:complete len:123 (-),score=18.69 TRINITY_DN8174_c0_g1_i3:201-569(-)